MAIAIAIVLLTHCRKDENTAPAVPTIHIDLSKPAVGQTSRYVLHYDNNYLNSSKTEPQTDTLILSILAKTDEGFLLSEHFGASTLVEPSDWAKLLFPNSLMRDTLYYVLQIDEKQQTTLLPAYSGDFPFSLIYQDMSFAQNNDKFINVIHGKPRESSSYALGYNDNVKIDGFAYGKANVFVDNREIVSERRGQMSIYNLNYGFIRKMYSYSASNEGLVWQLVHE